MKWSKKCLFNYISLSILIILLFSCFRTSQWGCGILNKIQSGIKPCKCSNDKSIIIGEKFISSVEELNQAEKGGKIVIAMEVEPLNLMPMIRPDLWATRIVEHNIYESLIKINPLNLELEGELAKSWEISTDPLAYTFYLREGIKWHDGTPFTGSDVRFTFDRLFDSDVQSGAQRSNFLNIIKYELIDNNIFKIYLKKPEYLFLQHVSHLNIIPEHIWKKGDFNTNPYIRKPIGTGPFKFAQWKTGNKIVLKRNEQYWGTKAYLEEINYKVVQDQTLLMELFKRGQIDIIPRLKSDQFKNIKNEDWFKKRYNYKNLLIPGFQFFVFNTKRPDFSDKRIRQALSMLIDYETIRCSLEYCLLQPISGPIPYGHPGYDNEVKAYDYNPQKAIKFLSQAGWNLNDDGIREKNNMPLSFTLLLPTVSLGMQKIATIIQQDFLNAGINMDIAVVDWSVYLQKLKTHQFDIAAFQWVIEWEDDLYPIFHSSMIEDGENYGQWENNDADKLLEEARYELDKNKRNLILKKLHKLLHEESPYVFTFAPINTLVYNRSIKGVITTFNWIEQRFLWIPTKNRNKEGRPK